MTDTQTPKELTSYAWDITQHLINIGKQLITYYTTRSPESLKKLNTTIALTQLDVEALAEELQTLTEVLQDDVLKETLNNND